MDSEGVRIVFYAHRAKAALLIRSGLATQQHARELRLTNTPQRAAGHSLPQYQDGQTAMMGPPLNTWRGEWTGAYGRRN